MPSPAGQPATLQDRIEHRTDAPRVREQRSWCRVADLTVSKNVNDSHNIMICDDGLIQAVAGRQRAVRASDTVVWLGGEMIRGAAVGDRI